MPVFEIEWVRDTETGAQSVRTTQRGSTGAKAVMNALGGPGGVDPAEVHGWPDPEVRELDEDGEYV